MAIVRFIGVLLRIMSDDKTGVLRLHKKHLPKVDKTDPGLARRLLAAQSMRNALVAGLLAILVFSVLWAMLSVLLNSVFPWLTLLLGMLVGLAIRHGGRGLDWRFPVLAAAMAVLGSLAANVVVAAAFTAPILDTTTFTVLRSLTVMTWPVFFDEVMTPADLVYAIFAAGIAAFYANRRLTRAESRALIAHEEGYERLD